VVRRARARRRSGAGRHRGPCGDRRSEPAPIYTPLKINRLGFRRLGLIAIAVIAVVGLVALPAFAASPAPSGATPTGEHPGKGPKASREPEVTVTLRGVVAATTDPSGETSYTLTGDGRTVGLDAGPAWFWGDHHPLASSVGKTVTITGSQSGDELEVATLDGKTIREPGRPPWAGGWKAVGSAHPGWSQDKADRFGAKAKALGVACWPPGRCKDHGPAASAEPATDR
jgi:hypothetical protein